jgi:2-keto-4-pentenoate hydratase
MTMNRQAIEQAARELREAYRLGPVEPIGDRLVENTAEVGYAVQDINTDLWIAEGRRLAGRKIGLTSQAVQSQLGVDQPDFGMLFEDMAVPAGGRFSADRILQPRAEGELAFGLGAPLDRPDLSEADVLTAVEWMAPAIEIVGSRVRDWKIRLVDTIADNASSGLYVIGDDRRPADRPAIDALSMELLEDDQVVSAGPATACLGSPVTALAWLARKMVKVGRPLGAGDIVLSGAFGPLAPMTPGHRYTLRLSGFADLWVDLVD